MAYRRERLRVETTRHIIEGVLQLPTEGYRSRTTDYLNAHDSDFIALTEATVRLIAGDEVEEHDYMAVNLSHAVLVVELEELGIIDEPVPVSKFLSAVTGQVDGPVAAEPAPGSVPPPGAA